MKSLIALFALFVAANAALTPLDLAVPAYQEIQPAAERTNWAITINRIRKEVKGLIEEFQQCEAYESDALKGTCFTHWSLRLASDIKQLVELIQNASYDEVEAFAGPEARTSWVLVINRIRKEIKGLIEEFQQCEAYESDALKGTCFTHWSLRLINDIKKIVEGIIDLASDDVEAFMGPETRTSWVIMINRIRKEIEGLVQEFQQCEAYESDALKGTCFTHWSLRLASDIRQLVDAIQSQVGGTFRGPDGWTITKYVFEMIFMVWRDIKELISLAGDCNSYTNDTRRTTCWVRFTKLLINDIVTITQRIIEMVNSYSLDVIEFEGQDEMIYAPNYQYQLLN